MRWLCVNGESRKLQHRHHDLYVRIGIPPLTRSVSTIYGSRIGGHDHRITAAGVEIGHRAVTLPAVTAHAKSVLG